MTFTRARSRYIAALVLLAVAPVLVGCAAAVPAADPAASVAPAAAQVAAPAAPAVNYFDKTYGTFAPVTVTGTSDTLIPIPAPAKAALVTATYSGSSNFMVGVLDKANQPTIDMPINTIGAYKGVTAIGLMSMGEPGVQLKVTAEGPWSITISPVSAAPVGKPASGVGDAVFLYPGAATSWTFAYTGASNFMVNQFGSSPMPGIGINKIGAFTGKEPVDAGPSVVDLKAVGSWTIS